ncbi:DUF1707 SHOCT-like domain-containing protein [Allonocardiopsis opalescens]|uniref:Uncharacterized protein DUF1707 n=1 Tax=Allonocardiopsis opalescens TaxID=1144618 RepID=A0A2T0Q847_9ACTN|nr:DUF1707 domain-containing protein [Allonocardiopsis opalescens]PRX99999.1 uncharacterized protein DUF1707 [Allonocardiopsis opalescens]
MDPSAGTRASDRDRDRVAQALRGHYEQGRLDYQEFDERVQQAFTAKTLGELRELTLDLPEEDLRQYRLPVPAEQRGRAVTGLWGDSWQSTALRTAWFMWGGVSALNLVIWGIISASTGGFLYPWWLWVAGPWGVVMLVVTVAVIGTRKDEHNL